MIRHAKRGVSFYSLVILIPLLIFVMVGEGLARRLAAPQPIPVPPPSSTIDPYQPNPYIVRMRPYLFSHIPGSRYFQARATYRVSYEINSLGFRGPEITPQPPAGLKRLLVIGDSIVEGHGNEFSATFAYLLNEQLRAAGWEVLNVGVQGASPIYFAANLERYLSLRPDAVLIVIFENDIFDDRFREKNYFDLPFLDDAGRLRLQTPPERWLSFSRFYTTLQRERQRALGSPLDPIVTRNLQELVVNDEQMALFQLSSFLVAPSLFDQQWGMSQSYLDYTVANLRQHQAQPLILSMSLLTLQPDMAPPFRDHAQLLDHHVAAWAESAQLPFLSLLPLISQAYATQPPAEVRLEGDGHPTPATHALLAETLGPWLLDQLKAR
jgi:lysophospholipase L1-like esterase